MLARFWHTIIICGFITYSHAVKPSRLGPFVSKKERFFTNSFLYHYCREPGKSLDEPLKTGESRKQFLNGLDAVEAETRQTVSELMISHQYTDRDMPMFFWVAVLYKFDPEPDTERAEEILKIVENTTRDPRLKKIAQASLENCIAHYGRRRTKSL